MNTSFRTAFWAMCLGLTVPMVLFVGVELTSGGRGARKSSVAAADHRGSLRSYWENAESKLARKGPPSGGASGDSRAGGKAESKAERVPLTIVSQPAPKKPPLRPPESEPADAQVTLGPQLEADAMAAEPGAGRDRRVPAVVTGNRPSVEILPESGDSAGERRLIEERLEGIEQALERLGRALAAQARRDPPPDPVKQTAELLRQLRQARDLEEPVSQIPRLSEPETEDEKPASPANDKDVGPARSEARPPAATMESDGPKKKAVPATKIYRPRYLSGNALRALIEPLLTDGVGKVGAADAGTDESALAAGGDHSPATTNAVVVHDFPEVFRKIDRLLFDLDLPPTPVLIEATVITVRLNGAMPHGIDLEEFNASGQPFAVTPVDSLQAQPAATGTTIPATRKSTAVSPAEGVRLTHGFGLKCGVLQGDPRAFLSVLQTASQTRRLSAWQLNVLNRQSAQLLLTDPFGPEGSVAQASAGTRLRIRPIVTGKGLVHLDIQRDVELDAPASGSRSAALTSQMALQEGQTAVIGGFFAEHLAAHFYRTPVLGQLPLVGGLFRKQAAVPERTETIVLLTPHVVPVEAGLEGALIGKNRSRIRPTGRPILKETAGGGGVRGRPPAPSAAASRAEPSVSKSGSPARRAAARTVTAEPPRSPTAEEFSRVQPAGNEVPARPPSTDDLDAIPGLELPGAPGPADLAPLIRPARESLSP